MGRLCLPAVSCMTHQVSLHSTESFHALYMVASCLAAHCCGTEVECCPLRDTVLQSDLHSLWNHSSDRSFITAQSLACINEAYLTSAGRVSTSFEKALARHFQPSQATSNPAAFAAAAELLSTILTDGHPQLLQVLQGSAIQQEADKVFTHTTQR